MNQVAIPTKEVKKWIRALRSGKYTQAIGALQKTEGYCCLGVACAKFIKPSDLVLNADLAGNRHIAGDLPEEQKSAPVWLKRINDDFMQRAGISLPDLNDGVLDQETQTKVMYSFLEIADLLEAVYVLKVLE